MTLAVPAGGLAIADMLLLAPTLWAFVTAVAGVLRPRRGRDATSRNR